MHLAAGGLSEDKSLEAVSPDIPFLAPERETTGVKKMKVEFSGKVLL